MAMASPTGASSIAASVANLTLGDPRCNSYACLAWKAEVAYYQINYGKWLSYYYVLILSLFTLAYVQRLWVYHKKAIISSHVTWVDKSISLYRSIAYRRIPGLIGTYLGLPSYGILALSAISLTLILILSFAAHPYYQGFGSPPLAIRAGLMSVALTPLIFALAGKFSLVTLLTGVSHEKLNVIHRYVSYGALILAIIHTVPYLIIHDITGQTYFGHVGVQARWSAIRSYEFTGAPTFGILVFLCFFSLPYFRARIYELFKYSHYAAAITYLGLLFWHCGDQGNSWYYLYATVVIFSLSLLGRLIFKTSAILGYHRSRQDFATVQCLDESMLRVAIVSPSLKRWSPGQHVFLRFPSIHVFANHPFTISSVFKPGAEYQEMTFLIRPYKGFTAELYSLAAASPYSELSLPVDMGGPYGGIGFALEKRYDSIILVAGGGGISSMLPWILYLSGKLGREDCLTSNVVLIWAFREEEDIEWVRAEFQQVLAIAPRESITLKLFLTGNTTRSQESTETDLDIEMKGHSPIEAKNTDTNLWSIERRRPNLRNELHALIHAQRTMVLGCGPESMKIDISNAVASAQRKVLRGEVKEIALHTETFGY